MLSVSFGNSFLIEHWDLHKLRLNRCKNSFLMFCNFGKTPSRGADKQNYQWFNHSSAKISELLRELLRRQNKSMSSKTTFHRLMGVVNNKTWTALCSLRYLINITFKSASRGEEERKIVSIYFRTVWLRRIHNLDFRVSRLFDLMKSNMTIQ